MNKKFLLFGIFFYICTIVCVAQFRPASFTVNGFTLPYQIMYPQDYDELKQYPLVVFLHGAGERGNDNELQLTHGKDFLIDHFQSQYPAIVIVPQCPSDSYWSNVLIHDDGLHRSFTFGVVDEPTKPMQTLIYLINDWLVSGKIKVNNVYVGGLSMGGMGTFELLWRMPDTFAAAFPICAGGDVNKIRYSSKNMVIWLFHGEADDVVPVKYSRDMYKALMDAGNNVKYTEYPDVKHNSWDNVFKEKGLVPWLFSNQK